MLYTFKIREIELHNRRGVPSINKSGFKLVVLNSHNKPKKNPQVFVTHILPLKISTCQPFENLISDSAPSTREKSGITESKARKWLRASQTK